MKKSNNHRTFTIRLSTDENSALEKLKKDLQISTDNGAIRYLISNYTELNKRYLSEQKGRLKAESEVSNLQGDFKEIQRVFKMVLRG